jgi:magnesium-transporting ATPase (P-type)
MNANIRVWVLTGDKKETALEIGKSCKLVLSNNIMDEIDLANSSDEHFDSYKEVSSKIDFWFYKFYSKKEDIEIEQKRMYCDKNFIKGSINKKMFIIIDGKNLTHILSNESLKRKFFRIGLLCTSVICSRVSPSQKSEVVKLAQENGHWITLSIGDGANDVPMIMTANIGIGISGKEGTQAVRSSDYSIGQFQFLSILLFTHGRWGYRRISYFIYYYFYKNILLVFVEVYYAFFNGFSGALFYADFLPLLYNALWTSWPSMFSYCIERDVDSETSLKLPKLYGAGQKRHIFNLRSFWRWILFCLLHGVIIYFGGLYSMENSFGIDGKQENHWLRTTILFSIIVHVTTYKIFIELRYWNKMNM